jgi:hypothetical protein
LRWRCAGGEQGGCEQGCPVGGALAAEFKTLLVRYLQPIDEVLPR